MTPEEFQNDEARRNRLREILADETMIAALAILKDEKEPGVNGVTESNPTIAASRYHQVAGINHVLKGLERLTKPYQKPIALRGRQLLPETTDLT